MPPRRGRGKKKKDPMKDIDKDLHEMDSESLNQILDTIQEKLKVKQIRRNYIQMDRDMVEKFFLNTKT